jgi:chromosomal replication initiator protein
MEKLWPSTRQALQRMLTARGLTDYLGDASLVAFDAGSIRLQTDDHDAALLFDRDIREVAEQCLLEIFGQPCAIELRSSAQPTRPVQGSLFEAGSVDPDASGRVTSARIQRPSDSARSGRPSRDTSGLSPAMGFDTFVGGACNRFAHAAALAVAQSPATLYNPLFIYGGVGLGKTHLMNAVGLALQQGNPNARVRYVSAESFANEFHAALVARRMDDFRRRNRQDVDILLVDDIQMIQPMEKAQEEFFHTFNAIIQRGGQIVITCDRVPEELPNLQERLRSRLGMGLTCDIQPPDLQTRREILARKAAAMNWDVPEDVMELIAGAATGNIRQLQGALHRVCSFAALQQVPLTLRVARKQLSHVSLETRTRPSLDDITQLVCEHFGVHVKDVRGRRRVARFSEPRKVAMYLCRQFNGASYPELGAFFERDHTTILNAFNRISVELRDETPLGVRVKALQKRLSPRD